MVAKNLCFAMWIRANFLRNKFIYFLFFDMFVSVVLARWRRRLNLFLRVFKSPPFRASYGGDFDFCGLNQKEKGDGYDNS